MFCVFIIFIIIFAFFPNIFVSTLQNQLIELELPCKQFLISVVFWQQNKLIFGTSDPR